MKSVVYCSILTVLILTFGDRAMATSTEER